MDKESRRRSGELDERLEVFVFGHRGVVYPTEEYNDSKAMEVGETKPCYPMNG